MELFLDLLKQTCCPHCWKTVAPEEVLWVSVHPDLLGDPLLPNQMRRFLPSRFNLEGNALDAKGAVCRDLACPHCHLSLPRAVLEMDPLYLSIIGSPLCGKSYFLTAMTWALRKLLPQLFEVEFRDADLVANSALTTYEENLFLSRRPQEPLLLTKLIGKTQQQDGDRVRLGNQEVLYPRPFMFSLQPMRDHAKVASSKRLARTLCLYDNAGESFLVAEDKQGTAVTHHLARSHMHLFLFDPTQDPRFHQWMNSPTAPSRQEQFQGRQDTFLIEAINRVRRLTGLSQTQRSKKPLLVVVTKFDLWRHRVEVSSFVDPWREKNGRAGLDVPRIQRGSEEIRALLKRVAPELVGAAESISEQVLYWPASALGCTPKTDPHTGAPMIRPADIQPFGVAVPVLYGLLLTTFGLIPYTQKPLATR